MKKTKAVIINVNTNLRDGIYFDENMALEVFEGWKKRYPHLTWILTTAEDQIRYIKNEEFCARNIEKLEAAEKEAVWRDLDELQQAAALLVLMCAGKSGLPNTEDGEIAHHRDIVSNILAKQEPMTKWHGPTVD